MPPKVDKPEDEIQKAAKKFRSYFIKLAVPDKQPELPPKLSSLSSAQVSDLQLIYTAWRELTEDLMVEALAEFTSRKHSFDYEYSKQLLLTTGSSLKEREAKVATNLRIHNLSLHLQRAELYYNMLSSKLESYTNCLTVISREITRRTNTT